MPVFLSNLLFYCAPQVNGWGFKRITEGPDLNAYYHELFLRGLPQVCIKMRRPQKGDGGQSRDIGQHPDFYKISLFAPLPRGNSDSPDASKGGLSNNDQRQRRHDSSHHGMQSTLSVTEDGLCIKTKSTQQSNLDERLGGSIPAVNDKPIRVDDSGSTGEVSNEVAHFSVSAITRSPPTRDCASDSASDGFGIRTPNDYLDGPDNYGNLHRAASGASLSSWNETEEQDLMWGGGMSGGSSIASPGDGYNAGAARLANQSFSQVTPPGRLRPIPRVRNSNIYGHHSRQQSNVRAPFGLHNFEETVDSTGLSVADLCYLTQQNRILLSQARRCEDQAS